MSNNGKIEATVQENVNLKYEKTFQHCISLKIKGSLHSLKENKRKKKKLSLSFFFLFYLCNALKLSIMTLQLQEARLICVYQASQLHK